MGSASLSSAGMLLELEILERDSRVKAAPLRTEVSGDAVAAAAMDARLRSFTALRKAPTRGAAPASRAPPLMLDLNKLPPRPDLSLGSRLLCRWRPRGGGRLMGRGVGSAARGLVDGLSGPPRPSPLDDMARGFTPPRAASLPRRKFA